MQLGTQIYYILLSYIPENTGAQSIAIVAYLLTVQCTYHTYMVKNLHSRKWNHNSSCYPFFPLVYCDPFQ